VVAWINGHSHKNKIRAHGHREPARAFWEITTASHVDTPQQARMIELADNGDGTLSLFTTLLDSAAPVRTAYDDLSQTSLASLYRELAYNSPGSQPQKAGTPRDRNTELLLRTA
jgi:hypothetical protein